VSFASFKPEVEYTHPWLGDLELNRVTQESGKRVYVTPEGNHYKSVTTWLGEFNQSSLVAWRERIGEEEANKISKRAAGRGTTLHENVENYLLNHSVEISKTNYLDLGLFKGIKPLLNNISEIHLLESALYSDVLKLAGTVDCVAKYNGKMSVIDFKTSSKVKDKWMISNYFLQTTIYSLMVEERYGIKIDQLVILIANEFGAPSEFIESRKNWIATLGKMLKESNHV
jgi:CRISPR/Cas system-associated exonuclease Cas4 (RecB family)